MKRYNCNITIKFTTKYESKFKLTESRINGLNNAIINRYSAYKVTILSVNSDHKKFCDFNVSVEMVVPSSSKSVVMRCLDFRNVSCDDYDYIFNVNYIIPMKLTSINK